MQFVCVCVCVCVCKRDYYHRRKRGLCFYQCLFVCLSVCLSVCLCVCQLDYSVSYKRILMAFLDVLGSLKSRRRTAYRHAITLASSLEYPKKIARENAKNCRCRQPHCPLTPPPHGTSANIRINLIPPETSVIGLHFCY